MGQPQTKGCSLAFWNAKLVRQLNEYKAQSRNLAEENARLQVQVEGFRSKERTKQQAEEQAARDEWLKTDTDLELFDRAMKQQRNTCASVVANATEVLLALNALDALSTAREQHIERNAPKVSSTYDPWIMGNRAARSSWANAHKATGYYGPV